MGTSTRSTERKRERHQGGVDTLIKGDDVRRGSRRFSSGGLPASRKICHSGIDLIKVRGKLQEGEPSTLREG